MKLEKILYLADSKGAFNILSKEYVNETADNINEGISFGYLTWESRELYQEYVDAEMTNFYDDALHSYKITPKGKVRLSIFRLDYAVKQKMNDKIQKRGIEYLNLLEKYSFTYHDFEHVLNYSEKKSIKKFHELFSTTPVQNVSLSPVKEIDEVSLDVFFNFSTKLGPKNTDSSRTNDYVLKKCIEELGELAVEDLIANGQTYKKPGADGVKGEAVDLAICAMDMFVLQCDPNMTAEEIQREFLTYMVVKLNKWKKSIGWTND